MNISALDNSISPNSLTKKSSNEELRQAAKQFEAILLTQLTSALSATNEDEDSLFGSDGGTKMANQMFAEQLATTMANAGGVGLAESILQKFGIDQNANLSKKNLSGALEAIKDIKESIKMSPLKNTSNAAAVNSSGDFAVISTFADDITNEEGTDALKNYMFDGKLVNSTRPRVVPNAPIVGSIDNNAPLNLSKVVSYAMPLSGRVSSSFGMRFHPVDNKVKMHTGVDIAVPLGTPIASAAEGVVAFAGRKGGYGNVVIVEHGDGRQTFYAHADKLLVTEGQRVAAGEEIAKSGSTGKSTGPHLHFEVRENGRPIDPLKFLANVLPKNADM